MKKYEILHEVGIKASASAVYLALTDTRQLASWWTSDTRGSAALGGTLEFWFGEHCKKFEVVALVLDTLVRWNAVNDGDEWDGTEITYSLSTDGEQCWVHFSHAGWKDNAHEFPHCSTKWAVFLLSLKDLLEKGSGHPFPNDWQINHS